MVNALDIRCQYLLLPRPWLKMNSASEQCRGFKQNTLYVRGDAMIAGQMIRLPYWHKIVWARPVES